MPLVAHNKLPTFSRLVTQGHTVLSQKRALSQDIRELHIGLLNMMPDAALAATENQFIRLVGNCNQIAQFYVYPFSLPELNRDDKAAEHIKEHYFTFEELKKQGLDALIISGANVQQPLLTNEPFWKPLTKVMEWSLENVASTLCSCLATHAIVKQLYNINRHPLEEKKWGVYSHQTLQKKHPLMRDINTRFDAPHSRYNEISKQQFEDAGLTVLAESQQAGAHIAVSEDQFRVVYLQGHPEYDVNSLLKEYKREVALYLKGDRPDYPSFPDNYLSVQNCAILHEYKSRLLSNVVTLSDFPEKLIMKTLDNTWHDSASAIINNWIGSVYQITNEDIKLPFMASVNPLNPLDL